jgi:CheY-like chemotaxis protein
MAISLKLGSKAQEDDSVPAEKQPFARDPAEPAPATESTASVGRDRKILVVDDNAVVLKAFDMKLRASGFSVFTTPNAASVAGYAEQAKIELILLDINFSHGGGAMDWSGFTVMQWLQRFPELASIPVIMVSSADADKYRDKALAAGAAGYFQKPVDYPQLLAAILKCLGD